MKKIEMSEGEESPPPLKRDRTMSRKEDGWEEEEDDDFKTWADEDDDDNENPHTAEIQKVLELVKQKREQSAASRKRLRGEVDFELERLKKMVDVIGENLNRDLDRIYAEDDAVLKDLESELHAELAHPKPGASDTLVKRANAVLAIEKKHNVYRSDNAIERVNSTDRIYNAKYTIECRSKHPSSIPLPTPSPTISSTSPSLPTPSSSNPNPNPNSANSTNTLDPNTSDSVGTDPEDPEVVDIERPKAYMFRLMAECSGVAPTEPAEKVIARLKAKGAEWASQCAWKECPGTVNYPRRYSVSGADRRIATMVKATRTTNDMSTVLGDTPIPKEAICEWSVQILNARRGAGCCILVGVAPVTTDQNMERNFEKCGWYYYCFDSNISSGPPHRLCRRPYGPRKQVGTYVKEGDVVGIVFDTSSGVYGTLSFVLGGVNRGVAVEGIPLDVPLVPAAILLLSNDSIMFMPGICGGGKKTRKQGRIKQQSQISSSLIISQQQQQQQQFSTQIIQPKAIQLPSLFSSNSSLPQFGSIHNNSVGNDNSNEIPSSNSYNYIINDINDNNNAINTQINNDNNNDINNNRIIIDNDNNVFNSIVIDDDDNDNESNDSSNNQNTSTQKPQDLEKNDIDFLLN